MKLESCDKFVCSLSGKVKYVINTSILKQELNID